MNQSYSKITLFLLGCCLSFHLYGQHPSDKIAPALWQAARSGSAVEAIVVFETTAKLEDLADMHGKVRKGRAVFERLQAVAEKSQGPVQALLETAGRSFQSFSVVNALYTRVDRELLLRIAGQPEVRFIQANPWHELLEWRPEPGIASGRGPVEWGLDLINVPEVWAQGITGEGVVIGNQDTGVEWTHPALKEKYRAWRGSTSDIDHQYHWFDAINMISPLHRDEQNDPANNPCGLSVDFPCDDNDHGTYTMGISVGDDGLGNQIGVAPGANWIACRNMERGYGSPATYLAGFEWFLAPTDLDGNAPRPELAPHVINNSWGCPEKEGCNPENWGILENAIENLRAAGIVVVVSAGNDGPSCGSVNDPSAIFAGAFAVGASDIRDTVASFSSRGPVSVDGSGRLKPDVVAPGVSIRSARRNQAYLSGSGTSAAGPFVAGVVALMIDANPELAGEVALIEQLIRETAVPAYDEVSCGGYTTADVPNPMTGYGRIDALAAVERARQVSPVEEAMRAPDITVYPNPGHDVIYFSNDEETLGAMLEIYDSTGKLIRRERVDAMPYGVDISNYAAGLYWWHWNWNGLRSAGKILKR